MADDGMLLNFELPTDAFAAPKASFKGGSWKDRLTARKSEQYGRKKAQERAGPNDQQSQSHSVVSASVERPAKRARTAADTFGHSKSGPSEVISSLFTYNPSSVAHPQTQHDDEVDESPVVPSNAPGESGEFTSLGLALPLATHLSRKLEIKAPTAIQREAVKLLCSKDTDAFIQAQTGSGKTLAYLLPIVERIAAISRSMKDAGEQFSRQSGLFAIILAPTRELARQINTVLEGLLACYHWIVASTVTGGEQKQREKARVRKGINILVATPGRLADHLNNTEALDVSNVRWLVLDEGDRLMELGFETEIQKIISVLNLRSRKKKEQLIPGLPDRRSTVLCSATIKGDVEQLRNISLKDPEYITVQGGAQDSSQVGDATENNYSAPTQLKQSYAIVPPKQRLVALVATLRQTFRRKGSVMKCIVFMSCADSVDFHFELLTRGGDIPHTDEVSKNPSTPKHKGKPGSIPQGNTISEDRTEAVATAFSTKENPVHLFRLHGSLQQATRTSTLKNFTKMTDPAVLVCTDVASRGLDLPNVDLVIEYDPPFSKDDHLHRVGRTARAGKDGRAMIFLQPGCEENYIEILKEVKSRNLTRHDAPELLRKGFATDKGVTTSVEAGWEARATDFQLDIERWAIETPKHLEQARRAYQSHIRAYATHVSAERHIFNMQELHLGHLAKAFALRDKPGSIKVPGSRPGKDAGGKAKKSRMTQSGKEKRKHTDDDDEERPQGAATDIAEAKRKMFAKTRGLGGASEFNLG